MNKRIMHIIATLETVSPLIKVSVVRFMGKPASESGNLQALQSYFGSFFLRHIQGRAPPIANLNTSDYGSSASGFMTWLNNSHFAVA